MAGNPLSKLVFSSYMFILHFQIKQRIEDCAFAMFDAKQKNKFSSIVHAGFMLHTYIIWNMKYKGRVEPSWMLQIFDPSDWCSDICKKYLHFSNLNFTFFLAWSIFSSYKRSSPNETDFNLFRTFVVILDKFSAPTSANFANLLSALQLHPFPHLAFPLGEVITLTSHWFSQQ